MKYVCFFLRFTNLLVCTICIYSNWSLDLVKNVLLDYGKTVNSPEKILCSKFNYFSNG